MDFEGFVRLIGLIIDMLGVLIIIGGMALSAIHLMRRPSFSFRQFRQDIGRAIILGLEFLVAGDIIRTVVVAPSMQNVLVLGVIVLIRTVLSMALEVEINGRWPWLENPDRRSGRDEKPLTPDR